MLALLFLNPALLRTPVTAMSSIIIRSATQADVPGMADIFFRSFNQKFWQYFCPDKPVNRMFISDMWSRGIDTPTDRSFVAIDTSRDSKIVGLSRWQLPQDDGAQNHDAWPEPSMLDQGIAQPFFGGMDENRGSIMGRKPHFCKSPSCSNDYGLLIFPDLDMIGVHEEYQSKGVAKDLMSWGIENADQQRVEVFLHSTEIAQSFYAKVSLGLIQKSKYETDKYSNMALRASSPSQSPIAPSMVPSATQAWSGTRERCMKRMGIEEALVRGVCFIDIRVGNCIDGCFIGQIM